MCSACLTLAVLCLLHFNRSLPYRLTPAASLLPRRYEAATVPHPAPLCCSRQLTTDERDVVWRFRYSLTQEPRALTKFLKCVDWKDVQEARQATELMKMGVWKQDIDVADALELLSPDFSDEAVSACLVSRSLGLLVGLNVLWLRLLRGLPAAVVSHCP